MSKLFVLLGILCISLYTASASYGYADHGADWPGVCESGDEQSPIDIDTIKGACDNSMVMDITWADTPISTTSTMDGNAITIPGAFTTLFATDVNGDLYGYTSTHLQIHAPSEHHIEGDSFDVEFQIYHEMNPEFVAKAKTSRRKAVVSIMFNVDSSASAHPLLEALQVDNLGALDIELASTLGSKLPSPVAYYTYEGSETYPPCEETYNWYIVAEPQKMTSAQYTKIKAHFAGNPSFANGNGNNRELQKVNDRKVKKGGVECEEQFVYFFSFFILYIFINYFIFKLL